MIIPERSFTLKNNVQVVLRSVKPSEAQLFLDHARIAHRESYRNLNRPPKFWDNLSVEEEEKILKNMEESKRRFMLGAFLDGKIIGGLANFGHDQSFQEFNGMIGISIQSAYHGIGLGEAMMRYGMEKSKEGGCHRLELTVRTFNTGAIALYEKLGFQKVGTLRETAFIDGQFVDEFMYDYLF
jgi:RimJ/RimL family protein N-acetyltransferase